VVHILLYLLLPSVALICNAFSFLLPAVLFGALIFSLCSHMPAAPLYQCSLTGNLKVDPTHIYINKHIGLYLECLMALEPLGHRRRGKLLLCKRLRLAAVGWCHLVLWCGKV